MKESGIIYSVVSKLVSFQRGVHFRFLPTSTIWVSKTNFVLKNFRTIAEMRNY